MRIRERYLADFKKDVDGRLSGSIHYARFLDLEVQDDPAAIKPPWGYYNPEKHESFNSVEEAFQASDRRLLLLGQPGAGKTTAIQHLASELTRAAQRTDTAPVPFLFNLSKFRFRDSDESRFALGVHLGRGALGGAAAGSTQFEDWVISEMVTYPGLDAETARQWLREQRIAILLDGLDEFNDERRADLARLLNTTFLRDHPHVPTVVCSRTYEYAKLQASDETRLTLKGCVHLQQLSDTQVTAYLEAAGATALARALPDDEGLRELTRTPLTLSMLVLTYGGSTAEALPTTGTLSERRHHLFEAFVARMLQRQARRERDVPFDGVGAHEIPLTEYRYRPASVNRWLGWLALTLSVRMRTSFVPTRLTALMMLRVDPVHESFNFTAVYTTVGVLMVLCLLAIAAAAVPPTTDGWQLAALMIGAAFLLLPLGAAGFQDWKPALPFAVTAWASAVVLGCAVAAHAICATLGIDERLAPLVSMPVAALALVCAILASEGEIDKVLLQLLAGVAIAVVALWALQLIAADGTFGFMRNLWIQGLLLALFIPGTMFVTSGEKVDLEDLQGWGFLGMGLGALAIATAWIGGVSWVATLGAVAAIANVALFEPAKTVSYVVLVAGILSLLAAGFGLAPATVAVLTLSVVVLVIQAPLNLTDKSRSRSGQSKLDLAAVGAVLDSVVLTPCVSVLLALTRRLPLRKERFLSFAKQAVLLKQSGREIEFAHRLLRDYFALRELLPRVSSRHHDRLETIRSLGYQGESALDVLHDLCGDADPRVRAAAISGLSHISSPLVVRYLESRLNDRSAEVRQALVSAVCLIGDPALHLLQEIRPLGDGSEIDGLFSAEQARAITPHAVDLFVERVGSPGLPPLVRYLRTGKEWQKLRAVFLLSLLSTAEAEAALVQQLQHEKNVQVRLSIVLILRRSSNDTALAAVQRSKTDRNAKVRAAALART